MSNPPIPDDRLTIKIPEVARLLSLSTRSVNRLIRTGELKAIKFGRSTRVLTASVRALVERDVV